MPQVKYHTVHKYGEQKRTQSKQLANARAKKRYVKPLKEILDNNKKIRMTNNTVIYTPDKPKLTSRTKKKLNTIANALSSGDSPSTNKKYSFKGKTTVIMQNSELNIIT